MQNQKLKKRHGNQLGMFHRERLNGGPFVDRKTKIILDDWNSKGVSYGGLIDRLTEFAVLMNYNPVNTIYRTNKT